MTSRIVQTSVFLLLTTFLFGQQNLQGTLKSGSFPVGVKQLNFNTQQEISQSLSIYLWYPAADTSGQKLTFRDYFDYKGQSESDAVFADLSTSIGGEPGLFSNDSLSTILNTTMLGRKDLEVAEGQYPLLVWSARYGTVEHQSILSEFLASHGYIVAYIEDVPNSPFPWQVQEPAKKEELLNQHIADIGFGVALLRAREFVDFSKIGMISWSYAGESAIFSQIGNQDIDLVIGLSSIGFTYGLYLGSELPNKVAVEELDVPYLILSERIGTNGKIRTAPSFFNDMQMNSRYVSFAELAHGSFNALEGFIPGIMRTNKVQSWSKGGELAQTGYEAICKITLLFLEANFKSDASNSFDKGVADLVEQLPDGFISIQAPSN